LLPPLPPPLSLRLSPLALLLLLPLSLSLSLLIMIALSSTRRALGPSVAVRKPIPNASTIKVEMVEAFDAFGEVDRLLSTLPSHTASSFSFTLS
jgi:hypothetical protein